MDIFWHREKDVFPTMDEYKAMVKNKTGTLASLAAQTGILASGQTLEIAQQFGDIAANIGIGFQIIDDVINLTTGNVGKKRGDDIVEGKKSLPILIHIHNNPHDKEKIASLMKIAQEEGIDSRAVEECISVLETSDCIQLAAKEGISLIKTSCQKFGSLLKCDEKNLELIKNLFEKMVPGQFK
jgi:octaprenyl-diphosphate synthase